MPRRRGRLGLGILGGGLRRKRLGRSQRLRLRLAQQVARLGDESLRREPLATKLANLALQA